MDNDTPHASRVDSLLPVALRLGGLVAVAGAAAVSLASRGVRAEIVALVALAGVVLLAHASVLSAPGGAEALARLRGAAMPVAARHAARFLAILAQLALLLFLLRRFQIENQALRDTIAPLAFGGFAIHHLAPSRHRVLVFLILSLTGIGMVLGVQDGLWLVAVGVGLIGLSHLPVPLGARVVLLALACAVLAAQRVEWLPAPWSRAVAPILGSMFMFRMIIYVFDRRKGDDATPWPQRLAYFFLLPNVVFPMFPAVDYGAFRRTYYDGDAYSIYQRGVHWMFRGVVHLAIYRLIYQHFSIAPEDVHTGTNLAQYLVVGYLVLLRLSGQFHFITGMLHLFGFNLPRTYNNYYLAADFQELWSRVNTYWRDFITKVFYFPVFFRLAGYGRGTRIACGVAASFAATWFLHAYQFFWILGSFRVTLPDVLFWVALGSFLAVNAVRQASKPRAAKETGPPPAGALLRRVPWIAGTFTAMCLLWSLFNAQSFDDWLALWSVSGVTLPWMAALALIVLGAALVFETLFAWLPARLGPAGELPFHRYALATGTAMVVLAVAIRPAQSGRLGERARAAMRAVTSAELNRRDAELFVRGYYENLMAAAAVNPQLLQVYMKRPANVRLWETEAGRPTGDFRNLELLPSASISFHGARFTTNRWGMRDRDYEQARPPGTHRMAVMGASVELGWGVSDDEKFDELLEDRLNRDDAGSPFSRYEVMNFSVPGYTPPQQLAVLDRVLSFEPDAVLVFGHDVDADRAMSYLAGAAWRHVAIPFHTLRSAADAAMAGARTKAVVEKRLRARREELLGWVYQEMARRCRERNAVPVWVFLSTLQNEPTREDVDAIRRLAAGAGFMTLDLSDVYKGRDRLSLAMSTFDFHPNAEGHRLIAEGLYKSLREHAGVVFRDRATAPPAAPAAAASPR
jgi:hypothetical protein